MKFKEKSMGTILVFARNEKDDVLITLNSISMILDFSRHKLVYVDDFSKDGTIQYLEQLQKNGELNKQIRLISKNDIDEAGIRGCIKIGLKESFGHFLLPIPGHHMFENSEINKIIEYSGPKRVVIGERNNLFRSRPFLKFCASKLFSKFLQVYLRFWDIKDFHGLNSYPIELLEHTIDQTSSHENHLIPLIAARHFNFEVVKVSVEVRVGHKIDSKLKNRPRAPKINDILESLRDVLKIKELRKKNFFTNF